MTNATNTTPAICLCPGCAVRANTFFERTALELTPSQLAVAEAVYAAEYAAHASAAMAYCRDEHDAHQEAARMAYGPAAKAALAAR